MWVWVFVLWYGWGVVVFMMIVCGWFLWVWVVCPCSVRICCMAFRVGVMLVVGCLGVVGCLVFCRGL